MTTEASERPRLSYEGLVRILGMPRSSWYTDSSESGVRRHLTWSCGCAAQKDADLDRLWSYESCVAHRATQERALRAVASVASALVLSEMTLTELSEEVSTDR